MKIIFLSWLSTDVYLVLSLPLNEMQRPNRYSSWARAFFYKRDSQTDMYKRFSTLSGPKSTPTQGRRITCQTDYWARARYYKTNLALCVCTQGQRAFKPNNPYRGLTAEEETIWLMLFRPSREWCRIFGKVPGVPICFLPPNINEPRPEKCVMLKVPKVRQREGRDENHISLPHAVSPHHAETAKVMLGRPDGEMSLEAHFSVFIGCTLFKKKATHIF